MRDGDGDSRGATVLIDRTLCCARHPFIQIKRQKRNGDWLQLAGGGCPLCAADDDTSVWTGTSTRNGTTRSSSSGTRRSTASGRRGRRPPAPSVSRFKETKEEEEEEEELSVVNLEASEGSMFETLGVPTQEGEFEPQGSQEEHAPSPYHASLEVMVQHRVDKVCELNAAAGTAPPSRPRFSAGTCDNGISFQSETTEFSSRSHRLGRQVKAAPPDAWWCAADVTQQMDDLELQVSKLELRAGDGAADASDPSRPAPLERVGSRDSTAPVRNNAHAAATRAAPHILYLDPIAEASYAAPAAPDEDLHRATHDLCTRSPALGDATHEAAAPRTRGREPGGGAAAAARTADLGRATHDLWGAAADEDWTASETDLSASFDGLEGGAPRPRGPREERAHRIREATLRALAANDVLARSSRAARRAEGDAVPWYRRRADPAAPRGADPPALDRLGHSEDSSSGWSDVSGSSGDAPSAERRRPRQRTGDLATPRDPDPLARDRLGYSEDSHSFGWSSDVSGSSGASPCSADTPDAESFSSSEESTSSHSSGFSDSSSSSSSSSSSCDTLVREGLKDYYTALNIPATPSPHVRERKKLRLHDEGAEHGGVPYPASKESSSPRCVERRRRAIRNHGRKETVSSADRSINYSSSRAEFHCSTSHPASRKDGSSSAPGFDAPGPESVASADSGHASMYDAHGRCLRHPHVQVITRRRVGGWRDGRWKTAVSNCTECSLAEVRRLREKNLRMKEQMLSHGDDASMTTASTCVVSNSSNDGSLDPRFQVPGGILRKPTLRCTSDSSHSSQSTISELTKPTLQRTSDSSYSSHSTTSESTTTFSYISSLSGSSADSSISSASSSVPSSARSRLGILRGYSFASSRTSSQSPSKHSGRSGGSRVVFAGRDHIINPVQFAS